MKQPLSREAVLSSALRFGVGMAAVAASAFLMWLMPYEAIRFTSYLTMYPAAMIVAFVVGTGPALLAAAIGFLAIEWYIVPPPDAIEVNVWLFVRGAILFLSVAMAGEIGRRTRMYNAALRRAAHENRENEERLRTLADNMSQFAWMADETGSVFWYNRRWFEYTGTTWDEMQGLGWRKVQHPAHVDRVEEKLRRCFESGEVWEDTFPLRGKDGKYRWFLSRAIPIRDAAGRVVRWFGTNTDVTQLLQAEDDLKEADRRKDEFLAMLGHELRNPLAAITTGLRLLRKPLAGSSEQWVLDACDTQTRQLVRLVDDLLDISRITRGKVALKPDVVSLADLIRRAYESVADQIEDRRHHYALCLPEKEVLLYADAARLQQVIANLLSNAAKYTPPGGEIRVHVACDDAFAVISVKDNGLGIPPEMRHKVFDLFAQVHSPSHRTEQGLGIGLNLVKMLVELHRGTIEVQSEGLHRGSEFIVRLPLPNPAINVQHAAQTKEKSAEPPLKILLVEDNMAAGRMLSIILEERGHAVRIAASGAEALAHAAAETPDLILLDIGLPDMSGYEVARRMRQHPRLGDVILVAATGYGQENDRAQSRAAGIDHHLVKPIDPDALASILWQARSRAARSARTADASCAAADRVAFGEPPGHGVAGNGRARSAAPTEPEESDSQPSAAASSSPSLRTSSPEMSGRGRAVPPSGADGRALCGPGTVDRSRALVIEDTRALAILTQRLLENLGFQASVAYCGIEGIEAARQLHPAIIFCDLHLPDIDGFEVVSQLRSAADLAETPIVAVTAASDDAERNRALAAGFSEYVIKPLNAAFLRELTAALLPAA